MSLLMDALKRAEKARQAQAEKQAEGKVTSSSTLTLDPIEVEEPKTDALPVQDSGDPEQNSGVPQEPKTGAQDDPKVDSKPDFEPTSAPPGSPAMRDTGPVTTKFSLSDDDLPTEKVPPPDEGGSEQLGPFSLVRDDELSLADTGEMLPVVEAAERSLNEYFDESSTSSTDPAGGPEPAATAMDDKPTMAGGRDSVDDGNKRAAQGVFAAKSQAVARYQRNRKLMMALPVLLLGVIGIAVLLFWDSIERTFFSTPQLLPPRAPQTVRADPPSQTGGAVESLGAPARSPSTAAGEPEPVQNAPGGASSASTVEAPESSAAVAAAAPQPVVPAAVSPESSVSGSTAASISGGFGGADPPTLRTASQPTVPPSSAPVAANRPYGGTALSGVRIARRSKPDVNHRGINEAYEAFQRGDNATAHALYANVHRMHPKNRNALLGLGALAVREGKYAEAIRHYASLLTIDPQDPIARAALINLNQSVPAGEGESHVRRLLAEDPEQPFLYYTLGNLYARQGRWGEAQRAYFEAYRRNSDSADYAFNLAVSLDQLGQPAAALTYYRRALQLAALGPAKFEPRDARIRIDRLTRGTEG